MTAFDPKAAGAAAQALFPNAALHRFAYEMAASHPYALDAIRQAPVIVLAANGGRLGFSAHDAARGYAAANMEFAIEKGRKLRDVMRIFGVGYHLRKLAPSVLHPKRWELIRHIGRLDPLRFAQAIPDDAKGQRLWIAALDAWADRMTSRRVSLFTGFEWAVWGLRGCGRKEERIAADLADFYLFGSGQRAAAIPLPTPVTFHPEWDFGQARAAQERWHAALSKLKADHSAFEAAGYAPGEAVPYAPFPEEPVTIAGLEFVPLRTADAIYEEGAAMHHCAATYAPSVALGTFRLYSIREKGARVATARYTRKREKVGTRISLAEIAGVCNSAPRRAWVDAAKALATQVEEAETQAALRPKPPGRASLRDAFPGITATFSGEAA